jgi:hypothetical protein
MNICLTALRLPASLVLPIMPQTLAETALSGEYRMDRDESPGLCRRTVRLGQASLPSGAPG